MQKTYTAVLIAALALLWSNPRALRAEMNSATIKGTSYEIALADAYKYIGSDFLEFFFTTYDYDRYSVPYYDYDPYSGMVYYSRELKKIGSLYYTDYWIFLNG